MPLFAPTVDYLNVHICTSFRALVKQQANCVTYAFGILLWPVNLGSETDIV